MSESFEQLRLKRDIAVPEVQLAEQRYDLEKLIIQARGLLRFAPPFPDLDYQRERHEWLASTDKFTV